MCAVGQKRTSRRFGTGLSNKSPVSASEFEPGMLGPPSSDADAARPRR